MNTPGICPPARKPYSQIRAEFAAHAAAKAAHIEANLAAAGLVGAVELRSDKRPDVRVLVTPSVGQTGEWRVSQFDDRGAFGHNTFATREAALRAASGESFSTFVNGPAYFPAFEFTVARVRSLGGGRRVAPDQT